MSDYNDEDFTARGIGYYRVWCMDPERLAGPFPSIMELASETDPYDYPTHGYIVHFDGEVIGTVPSLNPDDLLRLTCQHCEEVIYEDGIGTWCHESDGALTCERLPLDQETEATKYAGPTAEALAAFIEAMERDPADYGLHA